MIVITAVTNHAAISSAGDPNPRDISADTIKMPDPIIEPITMAVAENKPIPCTNWGYAVADCFSPGRGGEVFIDVFFTKFTFRQFYRKISIKSLATFFIGSPTTSRALITATESAPASITLRAFSRVIPPIATSGLPVNSLARRTPSKPIIGSASSLVPVANTGPTAI
jgi:hypothetical protein